MSSTLFASMERASPHRTRNLSDPSNPIVFNAPALAAVHHSSTVDVEHRDVLVDGLQPHLLYSYCLHTGIITKSLTSGDIPDPREGHTCCVHQDRLYLVGGCPVNSDRAGPGIREPDFYVLNLNTLRWSRREKSLSVHQPPDVDAREAMSILTTPRWCHTATITGDGQRFVIVGGRTSLSTAAEVQVLIERGFYDHLLFFDFTSESWLVTKSELSNTSTATPPACFNHTTAAVGQHHIAVFGGMHFHRGHTNGQGSPNRQQLCGPPEVEVGGSVIICDLRKGTWSEPIGDPNLEVPTEMSPRRSNVFPQFSGSPRERMNHRCVGHDSGMFILGGFSINGDGTQRNHHDCWYFNAHSVRWTKVEFCVAEWGDTDPFLFLHSKKTEQGRHSLQLIALINGVLPYVLPLEDGRSVQVSEYPSPYTKRSPFLQQPSAVSKEGLSMSCTWIPPSHALLVKDEQWRDASPQMQTPSKSRGLNKFIAPEDSPYRNTPFAAYPPSRAEDLEHRSVSQPPIAPSTASASPHRRLRTPALPSDIETTDEMAPREKAGNWMHPISGVEGNHQVGTNVAESSIGSAASPEYRAPAQDPLLAMSTEELLMTSLHAAQQRQLAARRQQGLDGENRSWEMDEAISLLPSMHHQ